MIRTPINVEKGIAIARKKVQILARWWSLSLACLTIIVMGSLKFEVIVIVAITSITAFVGYLIGKEIYIYIKFNIYIYVYVYIYIYICNS